MLGLSIYRFGWIQMSKHADSEVNRQGHKRPVRQRHAHRAVTRDARTRRLRRDCVRARRRVRLIHHAVERRLVADAGSTRWRRGPTAQHAATHALRHSGGGDCGAAAVANEELERPAETPPCSAFPYRFVLSLSW